MKIRDLIDLSRIKINLDAKTKDQAIKELAQMLEEGHRVSDVKMFLEDVYEREALGTTGIGFKIAIPHTKSKYVTKPSLVFGRAKQGIEFESLDGIPAELFFMIAMPKSDVNPHLKVLALLSRNLIHEEFRELLLNAKSNEEVLSILETIDQA